MRQISIRAWLMAVGLISTMVTAIAPAFAGSDDALSGYSQVVGSKFTNGSDVAKTIGNVVTLISIIGGAAAGGFMIYHFIRAGILMMSQGGARKEDGMAHLKWGFVGGAVALCAGVLAGVVALIATKLNS